MALKPVRYSQAPRKTRRMPRRHAHTLQRSLVFTQPSPRRVPRLRLGGHVSARTSDALLEFLAERVPDLAVLAQVFGRLAQADDVARPRQLHVVDLLDAPRPPRHDDDAVGERMASQRAGGTEATGC